jgi:hypothetical protein
MPVGDMAWKRKNRRLAIASLLLFQIIYKNIQIPANTQRHFPCLCIIHLSVRSKTQTSCLFIKNEIWTKKPSFPLYLTDKDLFFGP